MKALFVVVAILTNFALASSQTPNAQATSSDTVVQQLRESERLKDEAYTKGDKSALNRIYADDYVAIGAGGGTSTKQDLINFNAGFGQVIFESHVSSDISIRPFTEFAIVTGTYRFKYKTPARGDDSG